MIVAANSHPSPQHLIDFGLGRLTPTDAPAVEKHLDQCQECADWLNALPPDDFVTALRQAAVLPSWSPEAPTRVADTNGGQDKSTSPLETPIPEALRDHTRYRVARLLGKGGMGAVYQAEHTLMDRPVALKVINPNLLAFDGALSRFRQEVKAAAKLNHPNIVTAYDADQAGELTFLVMEHVEGESLAEHLKQHGPLPVTQACDYVRQAALGLQHAHEKGMVHRDIKPHNLMLSPTGQIKVLDFGLARFVRELPAENEAIEVPPVPEGLTQPGAMMGTADYVAPEQARDARHADIRADIYSLGCTLYQLLTGSVPYPGGDAHSKATRRAQEDPVPVAERRANLPPGLGAVVMRMMARDPQARYQTPGEVAEALAAYARPPERAWPRRLRRLALAGAMIVAVMWALVVWQRRGVAEEVAVETDDPGLELFAVRNGGLVRLRDRNTEEEWSLDPDAHPLTRANHESGLLVEPEGGDPLVLRRGHEGVLRVRRVPRANRQVVPANVISDRLISFGHNTPIALGLAVSPDGRFAVSSGGMELVEVGKDDWRAGRDADLRLWDLASGRELGKFTGHTGPVSFVAFSPDSRRIAGAARHEHAVRVWDVLTGESLQTLRGHSREVWAVAFTPDGRRLLSASWDKTIRLWDVKTGQELAQLGEGLCEWGTLAVSRDGRFAVAAGLGALAWFDLDERRIVRTFAAPGVNLGRITSLAISPDGQWVITGSGEEPTKAVRLWEVATGRLAAVLTHHGDHVHGVAITPDGQRVVSTGADATVRIFALNDRREVSRHWLGERAVSLALAPDGKHALVGCIDQSIRVVRLNNPPPVVIGEIRQFHGHQRPLLSVALSPDGKQIYSSGVDGTLRTWEAATGKEVRQLARRESPPGPFVLSNDGKRLLVSHVDAILRLWDVESGQEVQRFQGHQGVAMHVALSADGRRALSGGHDQTVRLWDTESGKELACLRGHTGMVLSVALSPDGKRALSGCRNQSARLWDLETGRELHNLPGHTGPVHGVAFSPDGRHAATSGGAGSTILYWDLAEPKVLHRLPMKLGEGHFVTFWHAGQDLIAGGCLGDYYLYDLRKGTLAGRMAGHGGCVQAGVGSSDGRSIVTAGADGTVRLWRLPARFVNTSTFHANRVIFDTDAKTLHAWIEDCRQDRFVPVSLGVRAGSREPRFHAVAVRSDLEVPVDVRLGLSGSEASQHFNRMRDQGYRLLVSCLYDDLGTQRQAHLWIKDGPAAYAGFGTTLDKLSEVLEPHKRRGVFVPAYLSAETRSKSGDNVTVVLAPSPGLAWETYTGQTAEQIRDLSEQWRKRGWLPVALTAYLAGEQLRFLAVAAEKRGPVDWEMKLDMMREEFQTTLSTNVDRRMMPGSMTAYEVAGESRYAMVWVRHAPQQ